MVQPWAKEHTASMAKANKETGSSLRQAGRSDVTNNMTDEWHWKLVLHKVLQLGPRCTHPFTSSWETQNRGTSHACPSVWLTEQREHMQESLHAPGLWQLCEGSKPSVDCYCTPLYLRSSMDLANWRLKIILIVPPLSIYSHFVILWVIKDKTTYTASILDWVL